MRGRPAYSDPDIERVLRWFLSFIDRNEWNRRKDAIEAYLESVLEPRASRALAHTPEPVSIADDRMGWYLYLAETALYSLEKYEPIQGARVLPIFKRLGIDFDHLRRVKRVEERVSRLVAAERGRADSGLFEILVALCWSKNGWKEVELITEAPPARTPDIRAASAGRREWFIECKRLAKSSAFSEREREKWLKMWRHVRDFLVDHRLPVVLDIVFHVDLDSLPETFLIDGLKGKLKLVVVPGIIVSNETWTVGVSFVDLQSARAHLKNNYVKQPSDQLNLLIGGHRDPNRGFTSIVEGKVVRLGQGIGNNRFLDEMRFAAGAYWHCDAERSIEKKARDIRKHLAEALVQLPDGERCAVHIGLETLDGLPVEAERYSRICNTVFTFDALGKDLRWVYCHLFQSYAPPEQAWVFDETVYHFSNDRYVDAEPLQHRAVVAPDDGDWRPGAHWLLSPP